MLMDIVVTGFFTVATFETRRASCVRPKLPTFAVPRSQCVPGNSVAPAPTAVSNSGDIEELLTCAVCMEIMYNPVSLITAHTSTNAGCCKSTSPQNDP